MSDGTRLSRLQKSRLKQSEGLHTGIVAYARTQDSPLCVARTSLISRRPCTCGHGSVCSPTRTTLQGDVTWETGPRLPTEVGEVTVGLVSDGSTLVVVGGYTCVTQVRFNRSLHAVPLPSPLSRVQRQRVFSCLAVHFIVHAANWVALVKTHTRATARNHEMLCRY